MKEKKLEFNVLHVCDYGALYRGNFIDSLESIEKLHSNVKNFYLFPARVKDSLAEKWIEEMNLCGKVAYIQEKNILKDIFLILKIIRKNKIDRIVRHFSDYRADIIIKLLFESKKVIRFFHCGYPLETNKIKHYVRNFIWKNNIFVGVSNSTAKDVKNAFPDFSVFPIVNAINFERLDIEDEFVKPKRISLLMMGWDYERKGVDLSIKAVNKLRERYDVILQIIGGVNEKEIKELARQILGKDADWIQFLPPTNNVGTYYKASDIFLSPSRKEPFGYANLEAVYCKNSIVLSKVDGQGELKIEGAYWVEPNNVEDLSEKIEKAVKEINSPQKIQQKERAKAQVEEIYSLKEWSNKLVDLFYI